MHRDDKVRIAQLFLVTSQYFGRELPVLTAQMYQSDVDDLSASDVKLALETLRREPKRRSCPLPAEIRLWLSDKEESATPEECAAKIVGAISRFGYTKPQEACAFMGDVAWQACEQLGGWVSICRRLQASELGTFSAQARELCRSAIVKRQKVAVMTAAMPQATQKRLELLNVAAIGS